VRFESVFAKTSPHVLTPELFALHLALHYVTHHAHINKAFIDILSHKWSRIPVDGKPHGWAFTRDGEEKGVISAMADATQGKQNLKATINVGLKDLLGRWLKWKVKQCQRADYALRLSSVLKTAGSSFEDFYKDEYTTLGGQWLIPASYCDGGG
jgi:urate oxidase